MGERHWDYRVFGTAQLFISVADKRHNLELLKKKYGESCFMVSIDHFILLSKLQLFLLLFSLAGCEINKR